MRRIVPFGRLVLLAQFAMGTMASSQAEDIVTWSASVNRPEWNKALGVTATRQGCSNTPAVCVESSGKMARAHNFKVLLAIPLNSATAKYASEYSRLSLRNPFLVEIGIDDFVDQYHALFSDGSVQPAALLSKVIGNLKSANSNLK